MWTAYAQSKLANMVFISELARRGIRVYASDPGMAARDSTSGLHWLGEQLLEHLGQSPPNAARATSQAVHGRDRATGRRLWDPPPN
jgi:NAD(P)-dependent dehydrogenase (short-subunit alcohol dehydrogenase family)